MYPDTYEVSLIVIDKHIFPILKHRFGSSDISKFEATNSQQTEFDLNTEVYHVYSKELFTISILCNLINFGKSVFERTYFELYTYGDILDKQDDYINRLLAELEQRQNENLQTPIIEDVKPESNKLSECTE